MTKCTSVDELTALPAFDRQLIRLHARQQRTGGQGTGEPIGSVATLDVRLHSDSGSQVIAYGYGDAG